MKIRKKVVITYFLIAGLILTIAPQLAGIQMENETVFNTPERAAEQAYQHMIQILETYQSIELDVDAELLKRTSQRHFLPFMILDFDQIVKSEQVPDLKEIVESDKGVVVSFGTDNQVVAVVQVAERSGGWAVIQLGNTAIRSNLNNIPISLQDEVDMAIYEVPNINILIYGVERDNREVYYTTNSPFNPREAVTMEELYSMLHKEAIMFAEKYGDRLREERLLK